MVEHKQKENRLFKYVIAFLILIIVLLSFNFLPQFKNFLSFVATKTGFYEDECNASPSSVKSNNFSIGQGYIIINTDSAEYQHSNHVYITGRIMNTTNNLPNDSILNIGISESLPVTNEINMLDNNQIDITSNGFNATLCSPTKSGIYYVIAEFAGADSRIIASSKINTVSSNLFVIILPFVASFSIMAWIGVTIAEIIVENPTKIKNPLDWNMRRLIHLHTKFEIGRFFCITLFTVISIMTFALIENEISTNSPFGVILKKAPLGEPTFDNKTLTGTQWWINMGGVKEDNYRSGLQIPLNIIIFGIIGGYIRYVYNLSQKEKIYFEEYQKPKENYRITEYLEPYIRKELEKEHLDNESSSHYDDLLYLRYAWQSLQDFLYFILSPILAIIIWLILQQLGTTNTYTLAAVSLAAGLAVNEFVMGVKNFATGFATGFSKDKSGINK